MTSELEKAAALFRKETEKLLWTKSNEGVCAFVSREKAFQAGYNQALEWAEEWCDRHGISDCESTSGHRLWAFLRSKMEVEK